MISASRSAALKAMPATGGAYLTPYLDKSNYVVSLYHMEESHEAGIDWPDSHADYWTKLAATTGATLQQARFAYATSTGMSATAAARFAGYNGEPRTAGYAAIRTRAVTTLLALAEQDGWEAPSRVVSEEEKDKLLNALMRSQDPQVRLRAIEASDKRREKELERERVAAAEQDHDPRQLLGEIAERNALVALALGRHYGFAKAETWFTPAHRAEALKQIEQVRALLMSDADTGAN
jgi:hypothetical protein